MDTPKQDTTKTQQEYYELVQKEYYEPFPSVRKLIDSLRADGMPEQEIYENLESFY